jgi:hypothetical protein
MKALETDVDDGERLFEKVVVPVRGGWLVRRHAASS